MNKFKEYIISKDADTRVKIIQQATPIHLQEMFMDEGKKWGIIENQATRKWPSVMKVFDLIDKNGQGDLHRIMMEIFEATLLRPELAKASSSSSSSKGSGKFKPKAKAKPKAKPRLKPIKEDDEIVELIKPAKNHLSYIDLNNDPYLINKIR